MGVYWTSLCICFLLKYQLVYGTNLKKFFIMCLMTAFVLHINLYQLYLHNIIFLNFLSSYFFILIPCSWNIISVYVPPVYPKLYPFIKVISLYIWFHNLTFWYFTFCKQVVYLLFIKNLDLCFLNQFIFFCMSLHESVFKEIKVST